ncbi:hypothetical protein QQX98_008984 [Neonectria punicea]|uniref:Major facilitator superfamily (MFS) profile domain-containing protein n=1 Tax=Neonectria punicea TaxID=979145 RepID=A0ABR1GTS9_9HYPO
MTNEKANSSAQPAWRRFFGNGSTKNGSADDVSGPSKWSMGVLNDKETIEVPGSVLLLAQHRNEPLGLRNVHARTSHSSIPAGFPVEMPRTSTSEAPAHPPPVAEVVDDGKKKTDDGTIILEPQPEESGNDPLNWPGWRRDLALLSLGFYCMIGGGVTPILAAGFTDVADTYDVEVETVALTTGLYMMGLGVGSVVVSPTAILYGKRPVYLASAIVFIGMSIWAAASPSFNSLLIARVFQGIAVSPVECLPSATIAEIFFLHERAFRIGIYTLLLLGGKNLIPLVSAAIIGPLGWRWVFWILAMVVALGFVLLFLFVPETFWDRTPHPKSRSKHESRRPSFLHRHSSRHASGHMTPHERPTENDLTTPASPGAARKARDVHVGFAPETPASKSTGEDQEIHPSSSGSHGLAAVPPAHGVDASKVDAPSASPYFSSATGSEANVSYLHPGHNLDNEKIPASKLRGPPTVKAYTHHLRHQPPKSFTQQLRPWHGRLNNDNWFKVMLRPFVLFAYPAVLWSSGVYACSVGWLIVVSESMAMIYRDPDAYNFDALQTGLVYISPFIGGILGTGVAGKISDIIVKAMARRNGGLYEPEFRLIMAIPIIITTCIGLMGFGWSADERDHWMVPTIFFGIISFGCSLGSTTAITFCVDSYRQYAGEALVTLNFSKNILHGLVFSLFVTHWLDSDGPKKVYIWIGIIQLILMLCTIPMYIYGKRARMWTVRMNLMEKL